MLNKILEVFCLVLTIKIIKALECEVGRNKPTDHTSHETSDEHPSSLSVDGDLNTYSRSSGYNKITWLKIDLRQEYNITRIVLSNINSTSTFVNRFLKSFNIEVSNREVSPLDETELYYWTYDDNVIPLSLTIRKTKRGQYVHVYKNRINYNEPLIIAEINIYAELTSILVGYECQVASSKSASQISTSGYLEANVAIFAIDDNLDTYSKTDSSSNNINTWLQVDLFKNYLVVKVVVSNFNYIHTDNVYSRNFAIFVRQTNETTNKVGNAFGSTAEAITAYIANSASPSIVFIKSDGEWGRYVTVIKQGPRIMDPLVIADLAVFANIKTLENRLQQCTSNFQRQETEINSLKTTQIVIVVVVGVLALIAGAILGSVCVYRFEKKSNAIPATYETTKIQNTDQHVYNGIDNTAMQQINPYDRSIDIYDP